ncbi:hypothetical protein [Streptomyces sp. NPDC058424]|uniref:hypothetical protein n=1 Tax=Streptomyces sp. NPDC058424 TaxID=3346491 RepID=UPI00364CB947
MSATAAPFFTNAERAALAFAEAVTRLAGRAARRTGPWRSDVMEHQSPTYGQDSVPSQ